MIKTLVEVTVEKIKIMIIVIKHIDTYIYNTIIWIITILIIVTYMITIEINDKNTNSNSKSNCVKYLIFT